jgi:PAS domain S-box-containing protein
MPEAIYLRLLPYGVALVADSVAFLLTWILQPLLSPTVFALFYPAIMLSGLYGGLKPGLFAIALATLATQYFLLPEFYSFTIADPQVLLRLSILVLVALLINAVSSRLHATQHETAAISSKLQESESLFRQFMAYSPVTAFIKDQSGRYVYVNPLVEQLFNRQSAEWIGKTDAELFPPDIAQSIQDNDRTVLTSGQPVEVIEVEPREEGDRCYLSFKFPLTDAKGNPLIAGTSLEITKWRQTEAALRESETRYRLLAEALPQVIWIADEQGQIEYCNQYWYHYTGLTELQTLGEGWKSSIHPDDYIVLKHRWQQARKTGESYEIEYRLKAADGQYYWHLASVGSVRDRNEQIIKWVGTAINIDAIKQTEAERLDWLNREQLARAEAEKAQAQAEVERHRLHEFFVKAPSMVAFVRGADFVYEFANPSYLKVVNRSESELIGKTLKEIFPEIESQGFIDIFKQIYQTGIPYSGSETSVWFDRHNNGILQEAFFNFIYQPVCSPEGEVEGILMHAVEVTEQVWARQQTEVLLSQLDAERTLLEAVLQQMPAGIIIAEAPSGKLILGNQQVEQIWRHPFLPSDDVDQYRVYQGFHADGRPYLPEEWALARSLQQGEVVTDEEVKILRGDGTYSTIGISSAPVRDRQGQIVAGVVTFQDISDRKQAEVEREQLLERERHARAEAEAANRVKDEFLAILSHELRTPLNPILGWARLLRSGKLDATKTELAAETIERNAKLQTQLIEDLLDISRILRGKLSLGIEQVDLAATVQAAIETVRLAAEAKSIQIQTTFGSLPGQVMGDPNRLQQVVWNLLSNAVKFTPSGGRIEIGLSSIHPSTSEITLSELMDDSKPLPPYAQLQVKDTGSGISPGFLPHVFEYFRQSDSSITRTFGGLGLGLAIARHLVELHGGAIQAESLGEGKGATFTVILPLRLVPDWHSPEPAAPKPAIALEGLNLLVVEDEVDNRELLTFLLEQQGAEVTAVASADEALRAIATTDFKLLICDIGLPELDGYELMRRIRSLPSEQGGQIPAIALTAYATVADQQQALSAGFHLHLAKPIESDKLVEAIEQLFKSNKSNSKLA